MSSKTIKVKHALSQTGKKLRADEVARLVHVAGVLGQHLDLALRRVEVHVRLLELGLGGRQLLAPLCLRLVERVLAMHEGCLELFLELLTLQVLLLGPLRQLFLEALALVLRQLQLQLRLDHLLTLSGQLGHHRVQSLLQLVGLT